MIIVASKRLETEKRSFSHINNVLMETHFVLNIRCREATAILSLDKLSHRVVCRLLFPKTNQFFLQDEQGGNIFLLLVLYYFMFLRNRSCSCIIDYARKIPFRLLLLHTPSGFFLVKPKLPLNVSLVKYLKMSKLHYTKCTQNNCLGTILNCQTNFSRKVLWAVK